MEEKKEKFTPGPWESKGRTICPKNQLDPLNTEIVCRIHENGKPGGPWNVPGEPGTWIAKAKEALRKAMIFLSFAGRLMMK